MRDLEHKNTKEKATNKSDQWDIEEMAKMGTLQIKLREGKIKEIKKIVNRKQKTE